jgi:hypothetical protein
VSSGTAFVVYERYDSKRALLTARHNVTGRNHFHPDAPLGGNNLRPSLLRVYFPSSEKPLKWFHHDFNLYEDMNLQMNKLWFEHPNFGADVDVVGLSINSELEKEIDPSCFIELSPNKTSWHDRSDTPYPSCPLQVIGFPLKRKENYLAVWSSGTFAYEPNCDFPYIDSNGNIKLLPAYLISARTFSGQSGSLVVQHAGNLGWWSENEFVIDSGGSEKILGMYTCRLSADDRGTNAVSDLGLVWKQHILYEILVASMPLTYSNEA